MGINPFASINEEIITAMKPILPTAHDAYSGTAKTYAMFSTYSRLPEINASGRNHAVGVYGDIDVFSDKDLTYGSTILESICSALEAARFVVKDVRDIEYDGVSHHALIEFYKSKPR